MIRKKIELREERDFGQKFNAVFTFVQSNFKPFIKVIGLTVGPLALVGGFFFGMVYSKMLSTDALAALDSMVYPIAELLLAYFFLILASLWMMIAVFAYMAEYESGNENITIEAVWRRGKGKIWPTIGFALLTGLAAVILMMIATFALPGYNAVGIFLKMLLVMAALVYVMVTLSLVIPDMVIGGDGLFGSIGRSFALVRGKWWSTFGIMMVMGLVASFATMIFAIPFYVAMIVQMLMHIGELGTLVMTVSSSLMFLGSYLMTVLPVLAIGFQYFNLVERKEGTGLLKKIDQLGKPVNTAGEGEF